MKSSFTTSLQDLPKLAGTLAQKLKGGEVLALMGDLGAGKTTFAQLLAKKLKVKGRVTSPTFVLMNLFKAELKNRKKVTFYHLDLYRVKNPKEVKALGISEFWSQKSSVTVIEWADRIKKILPKNAIHIKFKN